MTAMIEQGHPAGSDGTFDPAAAQRDRPRGYGHDIDYTLTPARDQFLAGLGVRTSARRRLIRY